MNILFLTTHLNTGGITSYLLTLGQALVKKGHRLLVASSGGNCVARFEEAGIRHVQMNIRTKSEVHPKLLFAWPVLNRLIRQENINIIHAQTRVTQVLGYGLSLSCGVKMVTTCHGFFRARWFRKTFPCWGEAVIAISRPVSHHLNQDFGVPYEKIHLIANGIDLNRFVMADESKRRAIRHKWNIAHEPVIGTIARLSDVKGIDILIKSMPLVLKERPSAILMIAGQGPEEANLRKLTQELSLIKHVRFENIINQPQDILPIFDVFVMPSLMEGLGLSVMEAQACGIPVVASRVGGLVDLIEDGKSGYLVHSQDETVLAGRILDIFRHPDHARAMALQARSNIENHFSEGMMVEETVKIYEQYSGC
ncbi:MAG: glycosyltransferase family 4 protein [Candidatus Omnitrophica bacterium]|nr:glycosyltransferase family 4 protein [Candidatus Omnitrophota bacterium]